MSDIIRTNRRIEWTFAFSADELKTAAQKKVDHHKDRLSYWNDQHTELRDAYVKSVEDAAKRATDKEAREAEEIAQAMAYMEEDEFELAGNRMSKVSVANTLRADAHGGSGARVVGDPEIRAELRKALGKVAEHRQAMEQFSRWVSLFDRSDGHFDLTATDAEYFGLS
jgi:hypothetical protein